MHSKPLVEFSVDYYRYPRNVRFGALPLLTVGLDQAEIQDREDWIDVLLEAEASPFHMLISELLADGTEDALFSDLLVQHGIFAPRFFQASIQPHIARRFAEAAIDLQHFTDLWEQDNEIVKRKRALIRRARIGSPRDVNGILVTHSLGDRRPDSKARTLIRTLTKSDATFHASNHLFLHTAVRVTKTPGALKDAERWFKKFARPKPCSLCGREYRVTDLPYWVYYGSNGCKSVCFACPIVASPRKKELLSLIPAFVEACGFIPSARASPIEFSFTSRLSDRKKPKVLLSYARIGGIDHVKKKFGSWFQGLAETEALPQGVLPTPRGVRCIAMDGHVCHSLDEQRIDDWLSTKNIPHEREPPYPPHPELNASGRRRGDWRVGTTVIEYFGLVGDESYDKKMEEKILLAAYTGMELIAIYPADLTTLEDKLAHLT